MLALMRYWLPGALCAAGIVILCFGGEDVRYEGFGLFCGAGLSLAVFAQLVRLNTSGDADRRDEEAARDYFTKHGRWPDEEA